MRQESHRKPEEDKVLQKKKKSDELLAQWIDDIRLFDRLVGPGANQSRFGPLFFSISGFLCYNIKASAQPN